jgi:transcription initiation factor TFIID subunit 2
MEGVPTKAQAEWRARKEAEAGVAGRANAATSQGAKRPRIYKGIISEVDLAGLLAQHKALMSGQMKSFMPPPGMPPMMGMPPPTFAGGMPMGMPPFMPPNGMPQ